MTVPRIYADFHNLDDANRLRLTCAGTLDDLDRRGVQLRDGLRLTFYMDDADDAGSPDDLLADGVAQYDAAERCWVAVVDWQTLRHVSDEGTRPLDPSPGAVSPAAGERPTSHRP